MGKPGMKVTGAKPETLNGWYDQRENTNEPPEKWQSTPEQWVQETAGQTWYEKDDGCFIQKLAHPRPEWRWFDNAGDLRYTHVPATESSIPPVTGQTDAQQGWTAVKAVPEVAES